MKIYKGEKNRNKSKPEVYNIYLGEWWSGPDLLADRKKELHFTTFGRWNGKKKTIDWGLERRKIEWFSALWCNNWADNGGTAFQGN